MRRNTEHLIISLWSPGSKLQDYIFALTQGGWTATEFTSLGQETFAKPFSSISDIPLDQRQETTFSDGSDNPVSATLTSPKGQKGTIEYAGCREPCPPSAHAVELAFLPLRQPVPSRSELKCAAETVFALSAWLDIAWALLITTSSSSPCPEDVARLANPFISALYGAYFPFSVQAGGEPGDGLARVAERGQNGTFWLYDSGATERVLPRIWPILHRIARKNLKNSR